MTFNEITKKAVQEAFEHARDIDQNLVDAQQTRRVLDRLVGYQISPLLWDKVRRGLSAGRVQTVAVRLIVEREREIGAFQPVEYWTLDAISASREAGGEELQGAVCRASTESRRELRTASDKDGKAQFIANALAGKAAMDETLAALEEGEVDAGFGAGHGAAAEAAAAVHYQPTAEGCVEQAGLQCAPDDGRGAAAL